MTEQAERYDRISEGYAQWWAPVIAPAAVLALDEVAPAIEAGATRILDVGTGTGTLAIELLRRWPHARVTAIDASRGMIEEASGEADRLLSSDQRAHLDLRVAFADDLPLGDASIDAAVSSFVLQLVPNRFRALREIHRVLRPGGVFGWVSWLARGGAWAPDDDFDDALEDVGEEPREWDDRPGDLRDPAAAVAQMRRAGFSDVSASAGPRTELRAGPPDAVRCGPSPPTGPADSGRARDASADGHRPRHPALTLARAATTRSRAGDSAQGRSTGQEQPAD